MDKENNQIVDMVLLGALIRRRRQQIGIKRAEDFIAILERYTGYSISLQTMYNIEQGKTEPKLGLYLAIMRVLFHDEAPVHYDKFIKLTVPEGWDTSLDHTLMVDGSYKDFELDLGSFSPNIPF